MARSSPARPKSTALRDVAQLRAEIRSLGAALGRVIRQLEGPATLATVERLRTLAKASRAGDAAAAPELRRAVAALTPAEGFNQAMAFTLYFELVNLAEENFRIQLLRQRQAAHQVPGPNLQRGVCPDQQSLNLALHGLLDGFLLDVPVNV